MVVLSNKVTGSFIATLTVFSYFIPIIPDKYKFQVIVIGFLISTSIFFSIPVKNNFSHSIISKIVKLVVTEKYFRFLYAEKTVIIDKKGNGKITTIYKLLNESGLKNKFPIKFWTTTGTIKKSLKQLESEKKFEVKTLDEHPLKWELISDGMNVKQFYVIFDRDLEPGETREYMYRFEGDCIYNTKKSECPDGKECTSLLPIFVNERIRLKIRFLPGYNYSNLRYCVKSPIKEELNGKCRDLEPQFDRETGGTYIEIEEKYPWRNFEYSIEWVPEN